MVSNKFSEFKDFQEMNRFFMKMDKKKTVNIFDEEKAIKIIKEYNIRNAYCGLKEDWGATFDTLTVEDGKVNTHGAYLESVWATPIIFDKHTGKEYDCYKVIKRDDK